MEEWKVGYKKVGLSSELTFEVFDVAPTPVLFSVLFGFLLLGLVLDDEFFELFETEVVQANFFFLIT